MTISAGPSAKDLAKEARKAEKKGQVVEAYLLYSQAAAADPLNAAYWTKAHALRTKAAMAANAMPASASAATPQTAAPEPEPVIFATDQDRKDAREPQPPLALTAAEGRKSFDLRSDAKQLWEQVARAYGLDVVFDGDYQPGQPIKFRVEDLDYREALYALMTVTNSFLVPMGERLVLVVKDTAQKRTEVENSAVVTIPIPDPISVQDAQELARAVQQTMEIQRFAVDNMNRQVILRGAISKVTVAQQLFRELMTSRAQVAIEVELLTVSRNSSLRLGLSLPNAWDLVAKNPVTLAKFGSPLATMSLAIGAAQVIATTTKSEGRLLMKSEVRALDGMVANFHVGDKYPVMTGGYFGGTAPQPGEQVYTPPPTFNFEDLGLVLKVTPKVHDAQELSLEIEAEFKVLAGGGLNGIPIISNRKFTTRARLAFGEWAIISGIINSNEARNLSGIAGLSSIPGLGLLLSQHTSSKEETDALLLIKPSLLSLPPTESVTHTIWTGTEQRVRTPL